MAKSPYARYGHTALSGTQQTARLHVVKGNETLQLIAAVEYPNSGYDSELWRQIAEYNDIRDLDDVAAGDVLVIPPPTPVS